MIGDILTYAVFPGTSGGSTFSAGGFGDVLSTLQNAGFFSYIIPFLLIFALVFGILSRMGLFKENRAVTAIIALAVGLMSLQFNIVPTFFAAIFPNFGIAISIILVMLIVLGLFIDPKKPWLMYVLLGIAALIVIIVLVQTAGGLGVPVGNFLQQNWGGTIAVIVIVGGVIAALAVMINSGKKRRDRGNPESYEPYGFIPVPRFRDD